MSGGLILSAIDALGKPIPWESMELMIKVYKKIADYPIK